MRKAIENVDVKIEKISKEIVDLQSKIIIKGFKMNNYDVKNVKMLTEKTKSDINLDLMFTRNLKGLVISLGAFGIVLPFFLTSSPLLISAPVLAGSIFCYKKLLKKEKKYENDMELMDKYEVQLFEAVNKVELKEEIKLTKAKIVEKDIQIEELKALKNKLQNTVNNAEKSKIKQLKR